MSDSKGALILIINDVDLYQADNGNQIPPIYDILLAQDLSHLTGFKTHFLETRSTTVEWWRRLFFRTPEVRSLGLRTYPEVVNALTPFQAQRSDSIVSAEDTVISSNVIADITHSLFSALLPKLSKLTLEQRDILDIWRLSHSNKF